ncbi:hypothetical protein SAMN05216522_10936 [Rosenbergiella nectarea]|uniref:Uncharacterized protein n=1 Tax=Rosenbergiella nectarea TaxID=988801 RepID=A0A1H9K9Y8_9GAMM|nr:hypothetical protein SAMN05216522_10936 [Rosenbergiella nectarea]
MEKYLLEFLVCAGVFSILWGSLFYATMIRTGRLPLRISLNKYITLCAIVGLLFSFFLLLTIHR